MYKEVYCLLAKEKYIDSSRLEIKKITNTPVRERIRLELPGEKWEDKLILEFSFTTTTEEPPHLKSNLKFLIEKDRKICFVVRVDLREAHINPSIEELDLELLRELEELSKSDQLVADLYQLLEQYQEHFFERERGHLHLFIFDRQRCDRWAIPIKEFLLFSEKHFDRRVEELHFCTISSSEAELKRVKIANILNFLKLVNFKIEKEALNRLTQHYLKGN